MPANDTAKNCTLAIQGETIVLRHVDIMRYTQGWQTPQFNQPHPEAYPSSLRKDTCIVRMLGMALLAQGDYLHEAPMSLMAGNAQMHWMLSGPRMGTKRRFHAPCWGEPAYVQSVPLGMESCMGGESLGKPHPLNPKGKGFVLALDPRLPTGVDLPQLELQDARLNRKQWIVPAARYPHHLPAPAVPGFELPSGIPLAGMEFRWMGGHAQEQVPVWNLPAEMPLGILAENDRFRESSMKPVAIDFHISGGVVRIVYEAHFDMDDPAALAHTQMRGGLAP